MSVRLMSQEWADQISQMVDSWPDEQEKADERKTAAYWEWVNRKRREFSGTFALGIRSVPGAAGPQYVALTFENEGACTGVAILDEAAALSQAKLALECDYQTWVNMANGYEVSKAMMYHQLPLRVGGATDVLRRVHFLAELITVALRPQTELPEAAAV